MSTKNDSIIQPLLPIRRDKWDIVTKDGDLLCQIFDNSGEEEAEEMIELIVRAVNAHQSLVDALERLYNDCTASDFNEHWNSYKQAQQALKLAKGVE